MTATNWCQLNKNASGRGINTLRNTKAIYYPIIIHDKCIAIIGFSCIKSKFTITEKLLFQQISTTLALDISILIDKKIRDK